jgi:hypothetical protein
VRVFGREVFTGVLPSNTRYNITHNIQERIQSGNKAYYANLQLLKSKDINRNMKMEIYKTLKRSVVTYSSETWVLKKEDKNNIRRFERKIIRKI